MAVYVIPYRGSNFWGAFGQGLGGIVGNLLNTQLQAMIDRGNQQRAVNQQKKMVAELPADYSGLTREQQEYALLTNSHFPLLSEDSRNRWLNTHIPHNEQTRGWEQQYGTFKDTLGGDAADILVGMQRAGTDTSIQREFTDIVAPTYNATAVDQGDRTTLRYTNPRDPGDYYQREYDKNVSPQDLLNAELMREGLANALEQTKAKGIVSKLTSRDSDLKHLVAQRESIVKELESGNIEQGSPVYRRRMGDLAAIDARLGEYYGYTHLIPQPELEAEMPTESQINKEAKKLMDDERAAGNDVSMEQALRTIRSYYGIE